MLLGIDIGNTQAVIGTFEGEKLVHTWRISTQAYQTCDEFRSRLYSLFSMGERSLKEIHTVVISSVVPSLGTNLKDIFKDQSFYLVDHRFPFSFQIKANPPDQIGADRLVNAEAVIQEYGAPAIIVDLGTATTLCAINENKEYLGGAIMAGVEPSMDALTGRTAKLFSVELEAPSEVIGTHTKTAIQSGIMYGYASMIDGMIQRFKKSLDLPQVSVIATGGLSGVMGKISGEIQKVDPDLTLKGIRYLYESVRRL